MKPFHAGASDGLVRRVDKDARMAVEYNRYMETSPNIRQNMLDDRKICREAIFALLEQRVHGLGGWIQRADPVAGCGAADQKEHFLGLRDALARFQRRLTICLYSGS